jgi:hypothetical protein
MRIKHLVLISLGIIMLLITSSLALYYQHQSAYFQREWNAAVAQLGTITAEPATRTMKSQLKTSAAQTNSNDANLIGTSRWEVEQRPADKDKPTPTPAVTTSQRSADPQQSRRRGSDWMENLRTNDPTRYEEVQQRRQEMQKSAENAWSQTTDYFMNRDTSSMGEQDMQEYNQMMTLLGEIWTLRQQLQSDLPRDDRRQVMSTVRSNIVALTPLLDNERNREFYDLAVNMGQSASDAVTFVRYADQITSNTSLRAIFPQGAMRGGIFGGRGFGGDSAGPTSTAR